MARLRSLGFRNLTPGEVELGSGVTLLWGANGAGKTSFLEATCLALVGSSTRTRREREAIAFGADLARVEVEVRDGSETRGFLWSLARSGDRRHLVDGSPAVAEHAAQRPALAVFVPDRLALVKGPPALRRGHLDRLCAALRPARGEARRRYGRALAQRNALLARARSGGSAPAALDAWDSELAAAGAELMEGRSAAIETLAGEFALAGDELGLPGDAKLVYRPRCTATDPDGIAAELSERRGSDLARGFTGHGPHLDDVGLLAGDRELRRYGSQGEQRTALLALLFAERRALAESGRPQPLMLLDDVMSELDPDRRLLLAARLAEGDGQAIVTATEASQLPRSCERTEMAVRGGAILTTVPGEAEPAAA